VLYCEPQQEIMVVDSMKSYEILMAAAAEVRHRRSTIVLN